jgi:hypothetical protein
VRLLHHYAEGSRRVTFASKFPSLEILLAGHSTGIQSASLGGNRLFCSAMRAGSPFELVQSRPYLLELGVHVFVVLHEGVNFDAEIP